ncbi:MAG: PQQ-binding-like beta-propeller repeat protein [Prevotellaceae bacterium]|jgi:outer membrane protein assembly factor BamB|nr:PQQ-binding-like beta-propeller repeat protein [Prevotellaceae bacterium]
MKNLHRASSLIFFLLLYSCQSAQQGDGKGSGSWPIFRGNPALSGYADISLSRTPTLLWAYKSGERTSSSPVVQEQTTYWSDKRGRIYGVNIAGEQCFSYSFNSAVEASPTICDSVLYIGRIDGTMSAISLATADTLWSFETQGQISAPPNMEMFGETAAIVFGSYDSYLYCIDRQTGKELTRYASGYYINGAAALWQGSLIFGGCDSWLRVVSSATGLPSDSLKLDTYIPASPAVDNGACYVADHFGNVYELAIDDGKIRRSKKVVAATDESSAFVSVPALSPTTLFVLSDDRNLYAIDRKSGHVRWKYLQKGSAGESSPVVCRDKVIACTKSGIVSLLSAESGELLWEYDTGEPITACPAVISGYFFILTAKGTLFCFSAFS